jgi:hypothetical protein
MAGKIWIKCELPDQEIEMIHQEFVRLMTYKSDKDGKLKILPNEKIKEHIGCSPDWFDVFIILMWFELQANQPGHQGWQL